MRLILFDAFLAACIATITAEFLSDGSLSSDQSLFQEELPQDLSWNDPETLIPSAEYDVFGGDLFAPQDISSSTTDLALSRLDAPLCLLNEGVQAPSRKARVRRDEGTSGSSCDAVSKPWHPSGETSEQPGKFDENIWKEFMGSPGDNQPEPEDPSTLFPILKDPKDENEKCPREFPKHLCCGERGPQESFNLLQPIYARMYQCEIAFDNLPCMRGYDVCCTDYYEDARSLSSLYPLINTLYVGQRCYQLSLPIHPRLRIGL